MKSVPCLLFLLTLSSCGFPEQKSIVYDQGSLKLQVAVAYDLMNYSDYRPLLATAPTGILFSDSPKIIAARLDTVFEDSVKAQLVSVYTKLPPKLISITVFSLLTNDLQKTVDLQSDTTISFSTSRYLTFLKGNSKDLLNLPNTDEDTVFIGHKLSGCFSDNKEKIVAIKSGESYKISYKTNDNSLQYFETIVSKRQFVSNFRSFIIRSSNLTRTCWSTTSARTSIRKGTTIYTFPVAYSCNEDDREEAYNVFKKSIGIVSD